MRARIARRGSRAAPARLGGARFERRREPAWRRCDRDRVVAAMEVGRANRTFFLYVGDFAIGVDVLITADDAAAIECGEAEETNDAHTANPRSRLADDPDGQGGGPGTMTLNRMPHH